MLLVCGGCQGGLGALRLTRVLGPGPIRQAQGRLDAGMTREDDGRVRDHAPTQEGPGTPGWRTKFRGIARV